jgi:hypothetical protein
MPKSPASIKATKKYDDKTYNKYLVIVPKGQKDIIRAHAEEQGESLSGYTAKAVMQRIEREKNMEV